MPSSNTLPDSLVDFIDRARRKQHQNERRSSLFRCRRLAFDPAFVSPAMGSFVCKEQSRQLLEQHDGPVEA